jgi:hypothetical protein
MIATSPATPTCERAGCDRPAIGKVRYGVLHADIENVLEASGPAIFSDKRYLCSSHYDETRKDYVFVRVAPIQVK